MTDTLEVEVEAEVELEDLTGHDRCDRCGAQAYVRVELFSGEDLVFCSHHYALHAEALEARSLRVRDERSRLDAKV